MRKYLFVFVLFLSALVMPTFAEERDAGLCQGCKDPNAISTTIKLPTPSVQSPPPVTLPPVYRDVYQPVVQRIHPQIVSVQVAETVGATCVNWQNVPCSCAVASAPDMRRCAIHKGRPDLGFFPGLFSQNGCEEERARRK